MAENPSNGPEPLSQAELDAEGAAALPDKEVMSLLDLNADLDLALDLAAPVDLAVAANANVAAPIDAAVGANVLSVGSEAQALADQGVIIDQGITGDAVADAAQDSGIDQTDDAPAGAPTDPAAAPTDPAAAPTDPAAAPTDPTAPAEPGTGVDAGVLPDAPIAPGDALSGDLLDVDVNLAADLDLTAPINGAVAANANVAAPIDAAVAANIGSIDSDATAVAQQDALITQQIDGDSTATADQDSEITQ
jgi:hypothetical protein